MTKAEELSGWNGDAPTYVTTTRMVFDDYGRPIESYDALNNKTTTGYTPSTGGPLTQVITTNPKGHVSTTVMEPAWGATVTTIDANDKRTDVAYDPLGRLAQAWLPGRIKGTHTPNSEHTYLVRTTEPTVVTTKSLLPNGTYSTTYELFDGWMRARQTQLPALGGRVISDTEYDTRGQVVKEQGPYYNNEGPPGTTLVAPVGTVPSLTWHEYDGAGRNTAEIFYVNGTEKWRTATAYGGDRVHVTPPAGAAPTTSITDVKGRPVELRHYHGPTPTGAYDKTTYAYERRGMLAQVTDPGQAVWKTFYDSRGRKSRTEDPDAGATTFTYDDGNRLVSTTDARGKTVAYRYDALSRKVSTHADSVDGPKLAEWTYDTVAKGLPATSTRYVGTAAYTRAVTEYDDGYRPKKTTITIPGDEGALAGTYQFTASYFVDGSPSLLGYPQAGGLSAEGIRYSYDQFGRPATLVGAQAYVTEATYTNYNELGQLIYGAEGQFAAQTWYFEEGTRRVTRMQVDRQGDLPELQVDTSYSYDPAGNITRIADRPAGLPSDVQCFRHDFRQRLTDAWTPASIADDSCAAEPSTATLGGAAPYWNSYSYDASGNRAGETRRSAAGSMDRTYTYPAADQQQPHTLRSVAQTDAPASGPTVNTDHAYAYDAAGNTTSRRIGETVHTLDWNVEGRLDKVTTGTLETSFVYDADGGRLLRKDQQATTLYLDGMELRLDKATNTVSGTRHYTFGGRTFAARTTTGLTWLATDHQGTATAAIEAYTGQVARRRFDPFGNPRGTQLPWPDERGFVGGTIDASTGLTHLGAREYDPELGRFVSVDPVVDYTDPKQMNGYAYANNSPVTLSDPDGLKPMATSDESTEAEYHREHNTNVTKDPSTGKWKVRKGNYENNLRKAAEQIKKRSIMDVVLRAAGDILLEFLGINDMRNCFTKGDAMACVSMVVGLVPWGKIFKVGKLVAGIKRAFDAVNNLRKMYARAEQMLKRANQMRETAKQALTAAANTVGGAAKRAGQKVKNAVEAVGKKSCTSNSFTPDTKVLMADGTIKPINKVKVGDKVKATNPENGTSQAREVTATITGQGFKHLVTITIDTNPSQPGVQAAQVTATDGHPFWSPELDLWVPAANLQAGQLLQTSAGTRVQIAAIQHTFATQQVHNLTIASEHTYHALARNTAILNHNCKNVISNADGYDNTEALSSHSAGTAFSGVYD